MEMTFGHRLANITGSVVQCWNWLSPVKIG